MSGPDRAQKRNEALTRAAVILDKEKRIALDTYRAALREAEADYQSRKVKAYERYGTPALTAPAKRKTKR